MDSRLSAVFTLDLFSDPTAAAQILSLNQKTEPLGLTLSPADVTALIQSRAEALSASGRIEIGSATIGKLAEAFSGSAYITQQNYTVTLQELLDLFYAFKNETLDLISDNELISFMKDAFENRCGGSLELLSNRELEKLAENLRFGRENYTSMYPEPDELDEDEREDADE
ncbi:DUF6323 family protein [Caproiciproducens faecalis]|uniref:Uncharacterized protein n=1 Tax=Caproiciproducens faecalis TaxID=2820301 RepID=A0ABS7DNC8_9FIRM|nr:DUF6323 family protein [Caproiciproducens faecalis]MBW7572812.1 hypothetical protein [Caproiciproducens faecalis]